MTVHSALPGILTEAVDRVLRAAGVAHRAHGDGDPMAAARRAAGDHDALALIGPFRSADVSEVLEATAPAGLPLLAPVATWAGITRDDEPCCGDPARHRGTVLRVVARDTEVAARIAAHVARDGRRAVVIAGEHEYGRQLDGQLELVGLPRATAPGDDGVVVLCGLAGEPEIARAAATAPLPVIAFDGVQGADLGAARDVLVALPVGPDIAPGGVLDGAAFGVPQARRAAELVVGALRDGGAPGHPAMLAALRRLGPFDEHGDPVDPPVWLWRADAGWALRPERPI